MLNTWILGWDIHCFLAGKLRHIYDANIFFPYPGTLTYSENLFATAFLGLPVFLLAKSYLVTYNFLVLLSFPLSALCFYIFVRELVSSPLAAGIGAFIYAFNPWRFDHLGHLQILTAWWIPLCFWALLRYHKSGQFKFLAIFGLSFILNALSNGYYMLFTTVAIVIFEAALWFLSRNRLRLKPKVNYAHLLGLLAIVIPPVVLVYKPYIEISNLMGFKRSIGECIFYSANLKSFITPPQNSFLWGKLASVSIPHPGGEKMIFIGLFAAALSAIGLIFGIKNLKGKLEKAVIKACVAVGACAFAFCFGPVLGMLGSRVPVPGPYAFLWFLPGFDGIRVPARFAVYVYFALALLSGLGLQYLVERLGKGWNARKLTVAALFAISVAGEYLSYPQPIARVPNIPPVYSVLSLKPKGAVMEIPLGDWDNKSATWIPFVEGKYMYFSTIHWFPLVNGYSGYLPPTFTGLIDLQPREQMVLARDLGVKYLVVHKDLLSPSRLGETLLAATQIGFQKVFEDAKAILYQVPGSKTPPLPPVCFSKSEFKLAAPELPADTKVSVSLKYSGKPALLIYPERAEVKWFLEGRKVKTEKTRIKISRPIIEAGDIVQLPCVAPDKPGYYTAEVILPGKTQIKGAIHVAENHRFIENMINTLKGIEHQGLPELPRVLKAGETAEALLILKNKGATCLYPNILTKQPVHVSYHWLDAETGQVVVPDGLRSPLPWRISPGEPIKVPLKITAPPKPGRYILQVSLVWERVYWLEQKGVRPLEIAIEVR